MAIQLNNHYTGDRNPPALCYRAGDHHTYSSVKDVKLLQAVAGKEVI